MTVWSNGRVGKYSNGAGGYCEHIQWEPVRQLVKETEPRYGMNNDPATKVYEVYNKCTECGYMEKA